tara:strand:- start:343 stop:1611 length:1269 start_codon:yes stop_codon:yes gene_type:complete
MAEIKWHEFIKDSLIIFILGIIYLIITINSIVLVKLFPIKKTNRAKHEQLSKDIHNPFYDENYITWLFPTDLEKPPYVSLRDAEILYKKSSMVGGEGDGPCSYNKSISVPNITHMLEKGKKLSPNVEWPYNWIVPYTNGQWVVWYFKFKIANIMMNQQWFARIIMSFFCQCPVWAYIPDWILFLVFPFSRTFSIHKLQPILPTLIWILLTWLIMPILGIITILTFIWTFFPPATTSFNCNNLESPTDPCKGPTIKHNLGMLALWVVSLSAVFVCISWYKHPIDMHSSWWIINELEKMVNWGGKWLCLLCLVLAVIVFLASGGFVLIWGGASMTIIWILTFLKTLSPIVIMPQGILEVFSCNNDIIALLLTGVITLSVEERKILPRNMVNSMWGVWGILLLMKVIQSVQKVMSKNSENNQKSQ